MTTDVAKTDVVACVEALVRELVGETTPLSPQTNLYAELQIESLELQELTARLGRTCGVVLPRQEVLRCTTLEDLAQLVLRLQGKEHQA